MKLHIAACDAEITCVHGEELFLIYVYIDLLELCSYRYIKATEWWMTGLVGGWMLILSVM